MQVIFVKLISTLVDGSEAASSNFWIIWSVNDLPQELYFAGLLSVIVVTWFLVLERTRSLLTEELTLYLVIDLCSNPQRINNNFCLWEKIIMIYLTWTASSVHNFHFLYLNLKLFWCTQLLTRSYPRISITTFLKMGWSDWRTQIYVHGILSHHWLNKTSVCEMKIINKQETHCYRI